MLLTLWAVTHRFHGLSRDGELYAFQAMAHIDPSLRTDLYLQNVSQDDFTIFSPIYAGMIEAFGLQNAGVLLFVICTLLFFVASWKLTKTFINSDMAWLTVGMLMITAGYYGASNIFSYAEPYLTARSMAESMAVSALALHFAGWRVTAIFLAITAIFVHPLMALPALLLLISLWLPLIVVLCAATCASAVAMLLPELASLGLATTRFGVIMDQPWLEVVQERSHFLFLNFWNASDWEITARPFVCLTLTALAIQDDRITRFCARVMLVGLTGLVISYAANVTTPIALLIQGQAWRWTWITCFASVLLLLPAAVKIWQDRHVGPLCATLLVLGWTCSYADELLYVDAALFLWLIRTRIGERNVFLLMWATRAIILLTTIWVAVKCLHICKGPAPTTTGESINLARIREVFGLGVSAALILGPMWYCMTRSLSWKVLTPVCGLFLCASIVLLQGSLTQQSPVGTRDEIAQFEDWRKAMPPSATVLVIPTGRSAAFSWFTLGHPNYLSLNQSAGVVFSRATALEVRRRSEVLLPLAVPSWRVLSEITGRNHNLKPGSAAAPTLPVQPLTTEILVSICNDVKLDFVIAQLDVGFNAIRHPNPGALKDWNLYDCRRVRLDARPV